MTKRWLHSELFAVFCPLALLMSCVRSTALSEAKLRSNPEVFVITSLTSKFTLAPASMMGSQKLDCTAPCVHTRSGVGWQAGVEDVAS